jgi:glycosyltransferase involved in cell wall biosynthesis
MPALLEFLGRHGAEYDRVLFWSFRYYQSFFGLPLVADRSILVPTAEDDEVVRLELSRELFLKAAGFLFLTPEEETLVEACAGRRLLPSSIVGTGLEPAQAPAAGALERLGITTPFVLFLGRVDPNKGCGTLLRYFLRHQAATASPVPLVLAGPVNMPIPQHPLVRALGYVDEETREALLWHASLLVMPSRFESLSLVLLEAWNHRRPALVNGHCSVLKGQALRSNGALYYRNYEEFAYTLDYLLAHRDAADTLGEQGLAYIDREYRWPQVTERIEGLLQAVGRSGGEGRAESRAGTENTTWPELPVP